MSKRNKEKHQAERTQQLKWPLSGGGQAARAFKLYFRFSSGHLLLSMVVIDNTTWCNGHLVRKQFLNVLTTYRIKRKNKHLKSLEKGNQIKYSKQSCENKTNEVYSHSLIPLCSFHISRANILSHWGNTIFEQSYCPN